LKYTLCFIAHTRQHHLIKIFEQLYHIDDSIKDNLSIKILNDQNYNPNIINKLQQNCLKSMIAFENIIIDNPTYFNKCKFMSCIDTDFIISCDEDIYLTTHGWNEFFKDIYYVNWELAGLYAPVISNGIPGVELFLDHYVDNDTRLYFRKEFECIKFENLWGAIYENLRYNALNYKDFFNQVNLLEHYYKGIHPIRVSMPLQKLLIDYVLLSEQWKNYKTDNNIILDNNPYFCNSIFLIPINDYKNIIHGIENHKLTFDGYDEVALNQYIKLNNKQFAFNLNSAAIHPSYNTIGMSYNTLSNYFYENI
jgi:hypothetical protein